jgi:hypothetical protein
VSEIFGLTIRSVDMLREANCEDGLTCTNKVRISRAENLCQKGMLDKIDTGRYALTERGAYYISGHDI